MTYARVFKNEGLYLMEKLYLGHEQLKRWIGKQDLVLIEILDAGAITSFLIDKRD